MIHSVLRHCTDRKRGLVNIAKWKSSKVVVGVSGVTRRSHDSRR